MPRLFVAAAMLVVAAGCHDPDEFVIGPDSIDSILALTISETTLPADGIARATITAQIDPRTDATHRTLTFTTSAGTLIGGGQEGTTATVNADASGRAIAELRSPTEPGSARVDVTVGTISRSALVEFVAADPAGIISIEVDSATRPADGASAINIVARVAPGLTPERRRIEFRTTLGRFVPGNQDSFTIDADGSNIARATLVSTSVGQGRVSAATADGLSAFADVTFSPALPDSLFVSPEAAILSAGESTRVTVTLLRSVGSVTPRLEVSYSAVTATGAAIGVFSGVTLTDNDGVSEATFLVPSGTTYVGPVRLRATLGNKEGSATVQIVPLIVAAL